MKTFEAKGKFTNAGAKVFTKQVKAENEKLAIEKIFSLLGGKQRISRRNIEIAEIKEVK